MHLTTLALTSTVALMANAIPHQGHGHAHLHAHQSPVEKRDNGNNFKIHVLNNCGDDKTFGIYQITSDFQMLQVTDPVCLPNNVSILRPIRGNQDIRLALIIFFYRCRSAPAWRILLRHPSR
jgi:hypothetical protein